MELKKTVTEKTRFYKVVPRYNTDNVAAALRSLADAIETEGVPHDLKMGEIDVGSSQVVIEARWTKIDGQPRRG